MSRFNQHNLNSTPACGRNNDAYMGTTYRKHVFHLSKLFSVNTWQEDVCFPASFVLSYNGHALKLPQKKKKKKNDQKDFLVFLQYFLFVKMDRDYEIITAQK